MRRTSTGEQQQETFRDLWSREGTLGRAARRYGALTNDYSFALREMLRSQLGRPVPGPWLELPRIAEEHPGLLEQLETALERQRDEVREARGRVFTAIAGLQAAALRTLTRGAGKHGAGCREITLAEVLCKDLMLMARVLVEQAAMYEAVHSIGNDHPADAAACETLYRASEAALAEFDQRLEDGIPLQEALAVEILLESLRPLPPDWDPPFQRRSMRPPEE